MKRLSIFTLLTCLPAFIASAAMADESYEFDCSAYALDAVGGISKLEITHRSANLDGKVLKFLKDESEISQSMKNAKAVYSNPTTKLTAEINAQKIESSYDGYPVKDDPTNIQSNVSQVSIELAQGTSSKTHFVGHCADKYIGD